MSNERLTKWDILQECEAINHGIFDDYDFLDNEFEALAKLQKELLKATHGSLSKEEIADIELEIHDAIEALQEMSLDDGGGGDLREKYYEALHERVDSHQYVIYYHHSWTVAEEMRCDAISCDEYEQLSCGSDEKDLDKQVTLFAYGALYGNCMDSSSDDFKTWLDYRINELEVKS